MRCLLVLLHFGEVQLDGSVDLLVVVLLFVAAGHVLEVDEDAAGDRVHPSNHYNQAHQT